MAKKKIVKKGVQPRTSAAKKKVAKAAKKKPAASKNTTPKKTAASTSNPVVKSSKILVKRDQPRNLPGIKSDNDPALEKIAREIAHCKDNIKQFKEDQLAEESRAAKLMKKKDIWFYESKDFDVRLERVKQEDKIKTKKKRKKPKKANSAKPKNSFPTPRGTGTKKPKKVTVKKK